jgi:hypothetical protein
VIENNAVKIIGDNFVLEKLNIKEKLDSINKIANPNNEKEEVLADHLRAVKNLYKNGDKTVIADHFEIKRKDYGEEMAKEIMAKAEFFYNDKNLLVAIKDFFNEGIKIEVEKILADTNSK